jgi:hypothetical protein
MANTSDTPKLRASRVSLWINVALVVGAIGIFLAWRRARDPHRLWAKRVDESHQRYLDTALRRCFGSTSPAEIRRVADGVRAGNIARPFSECHRGPMAELLVAPNSFIQSIQNPPIEVYRLRERERSALMRVTASARLLEQDVSHAAGSPSAEQREPLASKLEDLAVSVQHERDAFDDLVRAARDAVSIF